VDYVATGEFTHKKLSYAAASCVFMAVKNFMAVSVVFAMF